MSVKRCCVPLCNKSRDDNVILHHFPHPIKDVERFEIWKRTISGHLLSLDNQTIFKLRRVCHLHFERQYHTWGKQLGHHAVPTLNISGLRTPLQDVTNIAVLDTESSGLNFEPDNCLQFTEPQLSTSRGDTRAKRKSASLTFSPTITTLRSKIRAIQKSKESTVNKLKSTIELRGAPSFKENLQKFTSVAIVFTLRQFGEVGKPKMGRRFEKKEKIMALALYKQGPRAYRWLRKIFARPAPLTLSRMIQSANIRPEINENLFQQLRKMGKNMKNNEKLCILLV